MPDSDTTVTVRFKRVDGNNPEFVVPTESSTPHVSYRTHVQRIGWQGWRRDNAMAGTKGKSYRLEAIEIKLYGEMNDRYDVYLQAQGHWFEPSIAHQKTRGRRGKALRPFILRISGT
jgi:hypothetical protein